MKKVWLFVKTLCQALLLWPWRALGALRTAAANLLLLAIIVLVAVGSLGDKTQTVMPEQAILLLEPGNSIVEQRSAPDPFASGLFADDNDVGESVLHELASAVRWAAHDNHIKALVIRPDWLAGTDLAKLDSLAHAIAAFRESGKPVIAIGDNYSQSQYFLAAQADRIYLHPLGSVQLLGFGAYQSYLKDLLDTLAVTVHVFRAGQFKAFVEPFVRNGMSAEARENLQAWLDEQWHYYSQALEARRGLPAGSIDDYINRQDQLLTAQGSNPAATAKAFGLVDELATRQQTERAIDKLAGENAETLDAAWYYQHVHQRQQAANLLAAPPGIAVIHASGEILDGYQPAGQTGAETLVEQIRAARDDEQLAAIVLRIDSPGGSAFASELIRNELDAAREAGKPVVASMSGVAASGGYWLATAADEIWASPVSITGSIGVFGIIPTLEQSLAKLGVHSDGYSTTALADTLQLDRPMNPQAARVLQQGVDFTYQAFLQRVADNRKRSPEAIDRIAQGRVWTGTQAQQLGLVDHLGELEDAIAAAARLADTKHYQPVFMEPPQSPWESLWQELGNSALLQKHTALLPAHWSRLLLQLPAIHALSQLAAFNDPKHLYVRCWECRSPLR